MDGDTGKYSTLKLPDGFFLDTVRVNHTTFYTVYNRVTEECMGDNFTMAGACDIIKDLNKEDCCEDWVYYANENAAVLDSMASLVQDHQNSQNNLGGQG